MNEPRPPLHLVYRPACWDHFIGQATAVKTMQSLIENRDSSTFLLIGPSGCGKTSMARVAAVELGCNLETIEEIPAAKYTGVDDMREIQDAAQYMPLSGGSRCIIIDECFPCNTLIETPYGPKPIQDFRTGDKVIGAMGIQTVVSVMTRTIPLTRIVRLYLEDGSTTIVSREHTFLTMNGWIEAERLHGQRISTTADNNLSLQLCGLWDLIHEQKLRSKTLQQMLTAHLLDMWTDFHSFCWRSKNNMLTGVWQYTGWFKAHGTTFTKTQTATAGWYLQKPENKARDMGSPSQSFLYQDATPKSYVFTNRKNEDDHNQGNQWNATQVTNITWWQRNIPTKSTKTASLLGRWIVGICNFHWQKTRARWLAKQLQSRYWISAPKTSNRGRWKFTLWPAQEKRYTQDTAIRVVRVDCPTLSELKDIGSALYNCSTGETTFTFYDLQIAEHPSYGVNGLIAHNCHRLSGSAWDSLLKIIEEPPPNTFWFFCTTNESKVPKTIKTRCSIIKFAAVTEQALSSYSKDVCQWEQLKIPEDVLRIIAQEAHGSVRQLLVNLATCRKITKKSEAVLALQAAMETDAVLELCRFISAKKDGTWQRAMTLCKKLDQEAESVRIIMVNYLGVALGNATNDNDAIFFLQRMEAFAHSYNPSEGMAPLYRSIGQVMFR